MNRVSFEVILKMLNGKARGIRVMKQRTKTLPPKLKRVSNEILDAISEAKKIGEISIQEEVLVELEKVNIALEQARKEISRIMRLE